MVTDKQNEISFFAKVLPLCTDRNSTAPFQNQADKIGEFGLNIDETNFFLITKKRIAWQKIDAEFL
ncbi:MAG TPA: hypothetical protein ENH91_04830 [Leeuwenhoekiella sp.]|nr:hypothetical protein [Leeuwenhoekiella sp.]